MHARPIPDDEPVTMIVLPVCEPIVPPVAPVIRPQCRLTVRSSGLSDLSSVCRYAERMIRVQEQYEENGP